MQLVAVPSDVLSKVCSEIEESEIPQYGDIASEMIDIMAKSDGAGLAAPQVGIDKRLIVLYGTMDEEGPSDPIVMINPKSAIYRVKWLPGSKDCLSVPIFRIPVERPSHVHVTALDVNGARFEFQAEGFCCKVHST